jgi:hypothetical protein
LWVWDERLGVATHLSGRASDSRDGADDYLPEVQHAAVRHRNEIQVQMWMESRIQTEKGRFAVTPSQLQEQALQSAAFLIAAIADSRFGSTRISDELKDAVEILRGELDQLGLLAQYRRLGGTLVAWPPDEDGNIAAVLRRAGALDNKPSDLPHSYHVML